MRVHSVFQVETIFSYFALFLVRVSKTLFQIWPKDLFFFWQIAFNNEPFTLFSIVFLRPYRTPRSTAMITINRTNQVPITVGVMEFGNFSRLSIATPVRACNDGKNQNVLAVIQKCRIFFLLTLFDDTSYKCSSLWNKPKSDIKLS